jgi:hypothetical protein
MEEQRSMCATAWQTHGVVIIPAEEILSQTDRKRLHALATSLYGARSGVCSRWHKDDLVDRGDGEVWKVLVAGKHAALLQRQLDGALHTIAQPRQVRS